MPSISVNTAWRPTADELITSAMHELGALHAGQAEARPEHLRLGRTFLDEILQALQTRGVMLHTVIYQPQALTASQASYSAPADAISIEKGARVTDSAGNDVEVATLPYEEYVKLPVKAHDSAPTGLYPLHSATGITLYLWPRPTADYVTLTYPYTRRPRDNDTGAVAVDVPPRLHRAVKLQLMVPLARHFKRAEGSVERLQDNADTELAIALGDETPRGESP